MQTSIVHNTEELAKATAEKERTRTELNLAAVKESVSAFTGDAEQFDDLTMLCVRLGRS